MCEIYNGTVIKSIKAINPKITNPNHTNENTPHKTPAANNATEAKSNSDVGFAKTAVAPITHETIAHEVWLNQIISIPFSSSTHL